MSFPYIYENTALTATSSGAAIPLTQAMLEGAEGDCVAYISVAPGGTQDVYFVPPGGDIDAPSAFRAPSDGATLAVDFFYSGGTATADRPHVYAGSNQACQVLIKVASFGNY